MGFIKRKKTLLAALLALLSGVPLVAYALIGPKAVDGQLRPTQYVIPQISIADTTEVVIDEDGVIAAQVAYITTSGDNIMNTITSTEATIGAIPYPAKLAIAILDLGASSGVLTCTQVVLRGTDQFGRAQTETLSSIVETVINTSLVYETLNYYQFTGCASTTNGTATDTIRISTSAYIGLPRKLRAASDIISLCIVDVSDTPDHVDCYKGSGTQTGNRVSLDEAGAVDIAHSAVNLADSDLTESGFGGDVVADLDSVTVRIRAIDPPNL